MIFLGGFNQTNKIFKINFKIWLKLLFESREVVSDSISCFYFHNQIFLNSILLDSLFFRTKSKREQTVNSFLERLQTTLFCSQIFVWSNYYFLKIVRFLKCMLLNWKQKSKEKLKNLSWIKSLRCNKQLSSYKL